MQIRTKLALGLVLVLVINLGVSLYGLQLLTQASERKAAVAQHTSAIVTTALKAQVHFKKQVQEWKNILLRGQDPALFAEYLARFEEEEALTRETVERLIGMLKENGQAYPISERFLAAHRRLGEEYRRALEDYRPEASDPHLPVDLQVRRIDREPTDLIDAILEAAFAYEQEAVAEIEMQTRRSGQVILLVMVAMITGTILFLIWLVDRTIGRPITAATAIARRVGQGDFSTPIAAGGTDEPGQMLAALEAMRKSLLENKELIRAAEAKDEFLAAMSHELRTPLTSILGLAETLDDGLLGPLNDRQQNAMRTIQDNGAHLLELINDVLDMTRVAAGEMHLVWDQVPVAQLCDASLRLIGPAAKRKRLRVSVSIDPGARLVRGDSRRLKQMLINLLDNAVKFTPEDGAIGLDVTRDDAAGELGFAIWDRGIGIPADQLERLFEPFVQLDSRPTRQYEGTGLGLALAAGMAELHGGRIAVQSAPGQGSRFEIILPWDPGLQESAAAGETPELGAETGRPALHDGAQVLLVDDNENNLEIISFYLRAQGCRVRTARSGREALASAHAQHPDIILMDVLLPEMDGLETTRRLRAESRFAQTPIIALTALAMPGDRERCLDAGMDDYLSKPIGLKALHKAVLHWCERTKA